MSGNFTPAQRQIVRNRCQIDVENFNLVYQWLKENNPNFSNMADSELCPNPIILEDDTTFDEDSVNLFMFRITCILLHCFSPTNSSLQQTQQPYQNAQNIIFYKIPTSRLFYKLEPPTKNKKTELFSETSYGGPG